MQKHLTYVEHFQLLWLFIVDGEIGKDVVCMYNVVAELQGKAGVRGVNRDELVLTLQLQQGSRASPSLEFCSKQSRVSNVDCGYASTQ